MELDTKQELERAHAYLDHLPITQLSAVHGLLEAILDPVSLALANAPVDDESVIEEEECAVAEAREWLMHHPGIPLERVVAELGFTMDEVKNHQDPT